MLKRLRERLLYWSKYHNTLNELGRVDARLLEDIGLDPDDPAKMRQAVREAIAREARPLEEGGIDRPWLNSAGLAGRRGLFTLR